MEDLTFLGSVFIYDQKGFILTAAHTITNLEDSTFVVKNCNKFYLAQLVGFHNESDVCVMKINSKTKFSCLPLNTKRNPLKPGEYVITYGQIQNFDKENCSIGIINQPKQTFSKFPFQNINKKDSSKKTEIETKTKTNINTVTDIETDKHILYPYIQISNPINKGMSGSPLLDFQSNLIGMVQKKIDNYGLALPIHILKNA